MGNTEDGVFRLLIFWPQEQIRTDRFFLDWGTSKEHRSKSIADHARQPVSTA